MKKRRSKHDDPLGVDLFCGFGGLAQGMRRAGITTIAAANHREDKVRIHEANHPEAEHWIADLVDPESPNYHDVRDLPKADFLGAGVSCVNHSSANSERAYELGLTLFDLPRDPDYDARVTRSERDRATANCVLHYAHKHRPRLILVECTTELTSWGPALPGHTKIGDGSTFKWWLKQFENINYNYKIMYLNSMFFGAPQSRDRLYIAFWDRSLPTPDLDHRPEAWCARCDRTVQSVWQWRTGVPPSGRVLYGQQYEYRCPSCRRPVAPSATPALAALDLTDLGTRIGDRPKPLAEATMARAQRCLQRFREFPAIVLPNGGGGLVAPPAATVLGINNYQGAPRSAFEPLPTQTATETLSLLSTGVIPYRRNTVPTVHAEAMPTITADQIPGLMTAAGTIKNNGAIHEAAYRAHPVSDPFGTLIASAASQAVMFSGWVQPNGSIGSNSAARLTADWHAFLDNLQLEDCLYRMMRSHEIGRACGFDVDFPGHRGTFIVWGTPRFQTSGYGNAVTPAVGEWIGERLRAVLHQDCPL